MQRQPGNPGGRHHPPSPLRPFCYGVTCCSTDTWKKTFLPKSIRHTSGHKWTKTTLCFLSLQSGCKLPEERDSCNWTKLPQSLAQRPIFKFTRAKSRHLTHRRLMLMARLRVETEQSIHAVEPSNYKDRKRAGEERPWKGLNVSNKTA